jgi:hypothetical protein
MKEVPELTLLVGRHTLKLAKRKGVVNPEWTGNNLTKDRLHAYIRMDHNMYINVYVDTHQREYPRWTYRIDSLKDATCMFKGTSRQLWFPNHHHTERVFREYHRAYEAGLRHALRLIDNAHNSFDQQMD